MNAGILRYIKLVTCMPGIIILKTAGSLFIISFLLLFTSCREEIIPPDNPAANVNEIIQQRTVNSYIFIINADNISFDLTEYPNLNSFNTRVSVFVSDYSSGKTDYVISSASRVLYRERIEKNIDGNFIELSGNPSTIQIKCSGFSGKLKIQLTRIF